MRGWSFIRRRDPNPLILSNRQRLISGGGEQRRKSLGYCDGCADARIERAEILQHPARVALTTVFRQDSKSTEPDSTGTAGVNFFSVGF